MDLSATTALITGANRGLGRSFAQALIQRGARVYAGARQPDAIDVAGATPLRLDVTDPQSIAEAVQRAPDVDLLVNNAGISTFARLTSGPMADLRAEMETNYFGTLGMVRAFAPVLARNGGGAVLNVLSVMAWLGYEHSNGYGASKAAAWALTNGLRIELAAQGTQVTGLVLASTDTDMMRDVDVPKNRPEDVVARALAGLEAGALEVLADDHSVQQKATLSRDPAEVYPGAVQRV